MDTDRKQKRPILLVEDDEIDAMSVQDAFQDNEISNPLVHARTAKEALEMLRDGKISRPLIILLDLNLPGINGIEFLKEIKQDDVLKLIPVIVLTTSKQNSDKVESYKQGVAGYMVKPVNYAQFLNTIRIIDSYWSLSEQPE